MTNWISKATGTFKGDEPSPQAFELFCDCGQKHSGVRRGKWQRIICRSCGGSLFVLQKDPYPPPKERPKPGPAPPAIQEETPQEVSITENDLIDEELLDEPPPTKRAKSANPPPKRLSRPPKSDQFADLPPLIQPGPRPVKAPPTGFWKPFRIALVVIVLLSIATAGGLIRSSRRSNAQRQLTGAIDRIKDSLRDGQWVEARNQLEIAVKSLEILGQDNDDAKRYRQLLKETTAMTSLLTLPLSDLIQDAERESQKGAEALDTFQMRARGQWIVLDGTAVPMNSAQKRSRVRYAVPIPLTVGKENLPVDVVIESAELARLMAKSEAQGVIIATQIEEIRPSEDGTAWQVITLPESTVLWSNPDTYQGIGYAPEDVNAVSSILTQQAQSLGVKYDP